LFLFLFGFRLAENKAQSPDFLIYVKGERAAVLNNESKRSWPEPVKNPEFTLLYSLVIFVPHEATDVVDPHLPEINLSLVQILAFVCLLIQLGNSLSLEVVLRIENAICPQFLSLLNQC